MTIPLDNLYHYINGLFTEPVYLYLFYPHGHREISNLIGLNYSTKSKLDSMVLPQVICNDQEPLDYEFYQNISESDLTFINSKYKKYKLLRTKMNTNLGTALPANLYDNIIIIHSEKNSEDLEKYKNNGYIDVYYWSHALLSQDWYRFANSDKRLLNTSPNKDFLIYCRDWAGTREYRIKFQELLSKNQLTNNSITGIMKINGCGYNIKNFKFKNKNFIPDNINFFTTLSNNSIESSASADYCPDDFNNTYISIVLETIFDGNKIHLTEKTLRPIACGHPFIVAAGPGSLEYLRSYGFKTFDPWIDESYDLEKDSVRRLEKIIQSMTDFATLSRHDKNKIYIEIKKIADYNKKWFFSKDFFCCIENELISNINSALDTIKKTRSTLIRSKLKQKNINDPDNLKKRNILAKYLRQIKRLNPPAK
jgi:hypothetical protein